MSLKLAMLLAGLSALVGVGFGYFLRWIISLGQRGSVELRIKQMELHAREEAKKITEEAQNKAEETLKETRVEFKEKEEKIKKTEDRLIKKEEFLDKRQLDIDKEIEQVKEKVSEVRTIKEKVESLEKQKLNELQKISNLTEEEAKNVLIREIEKKQEEDITVRMQKLENSGNEKIESRAKEILTTSIQRLANSVSSEIFSTTVTIPSDEIKGKIIGKEGRNIKAFERVSGVEIIVDDTPGLITISSYDSVRRQVARVALENLIADGRIQPAKIEEMVEKAKQEINKITKEKGEAAAYECGVFNLDPRIISILGRLHFRTSYGQNVLQHSIEMSHISGMLAAEIGANVAVAKAGALLHDIGKAVDHEIAGTHVEIGRRILQKFGADEKIIRAMESHHNEYPYSTLESYIVQSADAISGARPGARRDSVENYLKRLGDLEAIATSITGVEKAYALQAGRELRIFVTPSQVNDIEAKSMARDIAVRIENELKYPGEIRVVVIRESRTIEFAR
ncbi:MAG: ribonuclease Y [Candidatus Zambryskibacteria bacterium RIFCSPLOWO2_01_FULL_39_39]|uniref:Ribonuclease Y n=1 Tax=Candidatus Zambryskibacteria bacterium RIFCSPLOWO2_01_FULL_39_39 TaxID=1802758 RepID=A0A1G2TYY7_9BACT|nr:MAG: Ribonuclease Y [Parcubacteria group bacterium GW2011_GWA1_38_7]OHA87070.1 MAG: ribonuclease Y [Candidatus Zambryskibacteria bacterium RIFCSPHIGHO2_01_FULL_39_63]OHA94611.1 MAG: ribonuclease Y [Candidatus Zambryskibacteria bacterium RIFCSPHIGHO2_02_FULL_39_19]OHA98062.1 MAG: ribonuclease Y [Candidatus Zambryskibacteria bacterium RIFCSPHIGHO2_12_FULL_39_21]OHB02525.1 MAG: ribonuclease Y [Candidatus Zambryskibacteria bacterium RIFCSPLOWO2_01_FULL_39_39]